MARNVRQTSSRSSLSNFTLISSYPLGYRAREDITNLPPGVLVVGSQNVSTNTSGRIGVSKGYTLDGAASTVIAPVLSAYDWQMHTGDTRHLRAGSLTSAGNDGKLQYRYVDALGNVTWRDLMTSLTSVSFNFCDYWDNTNFQAYLLFVDGSSNIYQWSGGITTFASGSNATSVVTVLNSTPTAGGANYNIGDILTITTGGTGATARVTGVTAGAVTAVTLLTVGSGYTTGTGKATTCSGVGTGCTLNITSVGDNTITKQGTTSWAEIGFYPSNGSVVINGTTYTYTSAVGTVLAGVSPNPTSAGVAGDIVHQAVKTTPNSSMSSIPSSFANSLIANLKNQIYVGSLVSNQMYVSKVNNYTDYGFTTPVRVVGEGAILTLDGSPTALVPQESEMYISAGNDQWYETTFTLSSDLTNEILTVNRLKTTPLQAAQTQALTGKIKNNVIFVSHEPILNTLGRVDNVVITPQVTDISFPIVNDFSNYDFTDGSVIYHKKYIYVAVPKENVVRIYNMTNTVDNTGTVNSSSNFYWEAPYTVPISRFSIIDGDLYGHSYLTFETYKLFDGYNFNGQPIPAIANFSYNNYGLRSQSKGFNQYYSEGYIKENTTLSLGIRYEIDGCGFSTSYDLDGSNTQFVCILANDNSLGKNSLGKAPLGGNLVQTNPSSLPPKFRWIRTFPINYFYEVQISYASNAVDAQWELLAHGPLILSASDLNNSITQ